MTDSHHSKGSSSKSRARKQEKDELEDSEHRREAKRMRTYSDAADHDGPKRRTRSMDKSEAAAVEASDLTPAEWRKEHSVTIQGHGADRSKSPDDYPAPFQSFSDAPFADRLQQALSQAGFTKPSAIQACAWPLALKGMDLISIAKTGSGKTCGFLLPAFHQHLQKTENRQGRCKPVLLVLAPTRELSVQIMEEAQKFGRAVGIRSICCYGGASKWPQIAALERGVECIIATPGRLNDLIEMGKANLSGIKFLVLDEADRMLDMGFEPQIRAILQHVPTESRQTMLFSATWPREIQALAHEFLKNPVQINVGEVNALVANKDIKQTITVCAEGEKFDRLAEILTEVCEKAKESGTTAPVPAGGGKIHGKVIVFVAKKISCHDLSNRLWDAGFAVDSLHGDRPQWERTRVIQAFKGSQLRVLIATDVAARGLDVKDVELVVNYDMPTGGNAVEDYVHRIGRTGRAGAKGQAFTFFTQGDKKAAGKLVQVLTKAGQDVPDALKAMVSRYGGGGGYGGRGGRGGGRGYGGYGGGGGGGRGYMGRGGGGYGGGRGGGRGYGRGRY